MDYVKRNLKDILLYGGSGLCIFFIALYLTLPYEKIIGDRIDDVEARLGIKLDMESISPVLPIGIKAKGVRFTSPRLTGGKALSIDRFKIKIPALSLLFFPFSRSLTYNFSSEIGKGEIDGILYCSRRSSKIALNVKSLDVEGLSPLMASLGFSVKGLLNLKLAVAGDTGIGDLNIFATKGEIELNALDFSIQAMPPDSESEEFQSFSSSPLLMALSMQPISLTKLISRFVIDKGVIELKEFRVEKQGLNGKISGSIKLGEPVDSSLLDLNLDLSFTNEENLLRPILMMQGSAIGCPLQPDNTVSCRLNGTIAQLAGGVPPSY